MATGLRVACTRLPGHVVVDAGAAASLRKGASFCRSRRSLVMKVSNSDKPDAPAKRENFFAENLIDKVKVRLGLKEQEQQQQQQQSAALSPDVEEELEQELEQELAVGLPKEDTPFAKRKQDVESLIEKVKARLGLKEQKTLSPGVDEEMERELAQGLGKEGQDVETAPVAPEKLPPFVFWDEEGKGFRTEDNRRPNLTSPGFSFSAAGHLFPYHLGVCDCLMEYEYLTENTPLAGSSAGALVCAVVAVGLEMSEALQAAKEVAHDCRTNGTAFRLGAVLKGIMEKYLPEDAHTRVNGKIRIAITQLFRQPRGLIVDQFHSREDLINALYTSCFIPGYFATRPVTVFRDRLCIDGGFTLFMPPTAAEETIRICAFFASAYNIRGVQISPDYDPSESRLTNTQLLGLAFNPAEDEVLDRMFQWGYDDALYWVKQQSDVTEKSESVP